MALHQRALPMAVSHYTQAGICGWLPLTAAYLKASQLQPALALLQHAVADSHSRHLCHDSALTAAPAEAAAARQLAAEWAALVVNVIRDGAVPGGLTQLLFPSPQHQQLGTSQVAKEEEDKGGLCRCTCTCSVPSDKLESKCMLGVACEGPLIQSRPGVRAAFPPGSFAFPLSKRCLIAACGLCGPGWAAAEA